MHHCQHAPFNLKLPTSIWPGSLLEPHKDRLDESNTAYMIRQSWDQGGLAMELQINMAFGRICGLAVLVLGLSVPQASQAATDVYTVAKYPIEAAADNAVKAKAEAMNDGRIGAFHALLKRLVPVTSYRYLPKNPTAAEIEGMIDGLNIRSEQNSSTEYLAEIDFRYNANRIRRYLQRARLPYLDRQAPEVLVVPIYRTANDAGPRHLATAAGQRAWRRAWADLDLVNTLTPVKLAQYKLEIRDDVRQRLANGDMSALRIFQDEYRAQRIILASAAPDPTGNKLVVTLAGMDAVGSFQLTRKYTIEDDDLFYTAELATVIGLGVLEGRWKAVTAASAGGGLAASGPLQDVRFFVRFNGLGHWQQIRGRLSNLPGVEGFNTGTVTARGAEVAMRYPGGLPGLRRQVAAQGMYFTRNGTNWVLLQN